ncbi:BMC domain-containing protein [Evansella clarkii]|jgi:microcompartment protein CcmL/EutN|uniref:BMC domain-containing protein n=1 Tax=Evansella clarkii TaxID=79879 RepID=UPI001FD28BCB|nr:BMC domain-containing protein [Evansella clarkii]
MMMNKALGMLEVLGFSVAMAAMDKACKQGNIKIEGIDCNNPVSGDNAKIPVVIQVKFTGAVSDVEAAMDGARSEALKYLDEEDILVRIVPGVADELKSLLPLGKVKRKQPL